MTNLDVATAAADEGRVPAQPRNYLRPCLLLLLREEPTYGYELRHKLAPLSAGNFDQGTVYRTLNTMEDDGLVHSTWERSAEGPRRRRYDITDAGSAVLDGLTRELHGLRTLVSEFIERYQAHHNGHLQDAEGPVTEAPPAATAMPPPAAFAEVERDDSAVLVGAAGSGHDHVPFGRLWRPQDESFAH